MHHTLTVFLEALSAERGLSQNTLQAYQRDLVDFFTFLNKESFLDVTPSHIRSYLESLHEKSLDPRTVARRLSALRIFYGFLRQQKNITDNPTCDIEMPKIGKSLPKFLSEEEVLALIKAAQNKEGPEGIRLLCLLELLYATGLRVSELVALPCPNIIAALRGDHIPMPLVVRGKGNKERLVLLSSTAVKTLKSYLKVRNLFDPEKKDIGKWLFPSSSKQGYLTRQRFGQLLKEIALEANVPCHKVSPHIIRHAFASHMLNNGADLVSLQKLLGHSDISTTEIYTHLIGDRLEQTMLKHHPLSDL